MASVTAELIIEASANTDEAQQNLAQFNDRVALVSTALGIFAAGAVAAGVALVDFARQAFGSSPISAESFSRWYCWKADPQG